jgi:uncharacterized protein
MDSTRSAVPEREDVGTSRVLTPSQGSERIELVDAVRGFALYGVLLANLIWLTQEGAVVPAQLAALPTAPLDRVVKYGVDLFVEWKFYTLFSFLFGLGFSIQLMRGERRGVAVLPLYVRRLTILFGFGVIHAYFLWYGDILHPYALLGFLLILACDRSDRFLLTMGIGIGVVVPATVMILAALDAPPIPRVGPSPFQLRVLEQRYHGFTSGSLSFWLRENADYALGFWRGGVALYLLPAIFGRFLLGFYAGRRRLLEQPELHVALFRRLLVWGLIVGVTGNALWVWILDLKRSGRLAESSGLALAAQLPIHLGVVAMATFYLASIVLLWRVPKWRRRLARLAPLGRMALTNYLMHSLIFLAVFYGFGMSLLGRVGSAFCLLLSIAVIAGQMVLSSWWLGRYRFGPAEWLWRSLTYGARQPMRLRDAA